MDEPKPVPIRIKRKPFPEKEPFFRTIANLVHHSMVDGLGPDPREFSKSVFQTMEAVNAASDGEFLFSTSLRACRI
jgi:hypothetical protein